MTHPARGDAYAYQRYFAGMDASMNQKTGFLSAHLLTDPGARILDLGCGSGTLSVRIAALAPRCPGDRHRHRRRHDCPGRRRARPTQPPFRRGRRRRSLGAGGCRGVLFAAAPSIPTLPPL